MALKGIFVGLTTIDIQYFVDKFPTPNTKTKTGKPEICVGGPATNAAVAFTFLGGKANLYSAVGENPFHEFVLNDFRKNQIKHYDILAGEHDMPVLASVITSLNNGDRTIFTYNPPDVANKLPAKEIIKSQNPDFVFIDGFYPGVALDFAKEAKKKNIPLIFDGGSWKPHLEELLSFVDIAICSDQFLPPACNTEIFDFLLKKGATDIIITRGHENILYKNRKVKKEFEIEKVDLIDTLGAGDFFHGAFCYYYLATENIEDAIKKSSVLALETCKYAGTRSWLRKLDKESFM